MSIEVYQMVIKSANYDNQKLYHATFATHVTGLCSLYEAENGLVLFIKGNLFNFGIWVFANLPPELNGLDIFLLLYTMNGIMEAAARDKPQCWLLG